MARNEPRLRAASLVWQGRLSGLVELQPAVDPPPEIWARIDEQVRLNQHSEDAAIAAGVAARAAKPTEVARRAPLPARAARWSSLQWWRALALGGGASSAGPRGRRRGAAPDTGTVIGATAQREPGAVATRAGRTSPTGQRRAGRVRGRVVGRQVVGVGARHL